MNQVVTVTGTSDADIADELVNVTLTNADAPAPTVVAVTVDDQTIVSDIGWPTYFGTAGSLGAGTVIAFKVTIARPARSTASAWSPARPAATARWRSTSTTAACPTRWSPRSTARSRSAPAPSSSTPPTRRSTPAPTGSRCGSARRPRSARPGPDRLPLHPLAGQLQRVVAGGVRHRELGSNAGLLNMFVPHLPSMSTPPGVGSARSRTPRLDSRRAR